MPKPNRGKTETIKDRTIYVIMEYILARLRDAGVIEGEIIVCDATFIKAYSRRDLKDDSRGYSDPDARVGRADRGYSCRAAPRRLGAFLNLKH